MRKISFATIALGVLTVMSFITVRAEAATYGTFFGTDFMFGNVNDSTSPDDGLYGPGANISTTGNALEFQPTGFTATAVGGASPSSDGKTSVIQSQIMKTGLQPINVIRIVESGTYDFTNATAGDWSEVQVSGSLTLTRLSPSPALFTFTNFAQTHMSMDVNENGTFLFEIEIDVSAWNATSIMLSHSNFVEATTGGLGTVGSISKTGFSIIINPDTPITDPPIGFVPKAVPVPNAVWAGLAGLVFAVTLRRRITG